MTLSFAAKCTLAGSVAGFAACAGFAIAQTAPPPTAPQWKAQSQVPATAPPTKARPAPQAPAAAAPVAAPVAPPGAAPIQTGSTQAPTVFQTVEQLQKAGVKRCLEMAQAMGQGTLAGSANYAAASTWNSKQPDNRFTLSVIGHQYAGGQNSTPNGMSTVVSVPTAEGKCDAAALQVIPTTDSCQAVQAQILTKGKVLGNLAGVALLQNAANAQVMLLAGAANSCVLVVVNTIFTE